MNTNTSSGTSTMASSGKRPLDLLCDVAAGPDRPAKVARSDRELQPYPFYFYKDFSEVEDPDPLMPVTPPGRVPNFAAKMYAILSRSDLKDVVAWAPHGRAWKILKPREFEIRVIPSYFEHNKLSSFIRQANGWGFRRITQGPDKNCYYHEQFLRGLPHLIKSMKRPGVAEKKAMDAAQEPDLAEISKLHPVPEKEDGNTLLEFNLQGSSSSKTRSAPSYAGAAKGRIAPLPPTMPATPSLATSPTEHLKLSCFEKSISVSETVVSKKQDTTPTQTLAATASASSEDNVSPITLPKNSSGSTLSALSAASQMAFQVPAFDPQAAAQFAAGFAFATAFTQQHFTNIFGNLHRHNHQQ